MYSHLVTVEVSVVCRTHQWVQLNRFTFNQYRFKRLDTQTVKCWRTVQQYWMLTDNLIEDIPYQRLFALNHLLRSLDSRSVTTQFELAEDEWLEQLKCHLLR